MHMETGVGVVHLFCDTTDHVDRAAVEAAVDQARSDDLQVVTAKLLGHKAEMCFMVLGADLAAIHRFQRAIKSAGLNLVDSYVSITEVSEYAPNLPEHMLQDRLYPQLPPEGKSAFCFYPMTKARAGHANWYATDYERRRDMMYEHGMSGRKFSGKITQLITASTGLDSHEWGVTLFAVNLEVIKDVVYTLRFDEASALYGVFGDFWVGFLAETDDLW